MRTLLAGLASAGLVAAAVPDAGGQQVTATLVRQCLLKDDRPVMLLTTNTRVFMHAAPDRSSPLLEQLPLFWPLFVYSTGTPQRKAAASGQGFYNVGLTPASRDDLGWVPADQVMSWRGSLCARLTPPETRGTVVHVYESPEDLVQTISSGDPLARPPKSRELTDTGNATLRMLFPILETRQVNVGGTPLSLLKIAYPACASPEITALLTVGNALDVVFVLDTTHSMQAHMVNATSAIKELCYQVRQLLPGQAAVRFGLVAFRDDEKPTRQKGMAYTTKWFSNLTEDMGDFLGILMEVDASSIPSEDLQDALLEGLWTAIKESRWREDASRIIVVIGDSSGHEGEHPRNRSERTREGVSALAAEAHIRIVAIKINSTKPGIKVLEDQELHRAQLKALAAGGDPRTEGLYEEMSPEGGISNVKEHLSMLLQKESEENARDRRRRAWELAEETMRSPIGGRGGELPAMVSWVASQRFGTGESVAVDSGWIAEEVGGSPCATPCVWISEHELLAMAHVLKGVEVLASDPTVAFFETLAADLRALSGRELEADDDLSTFLRTATGLPITNRLLGCSLASLQQWDSARRSRLQLEVREKQRELHDLETSAQWINITEDYRIMFLPSEYLP